MRYLAYNRTVKDTQVTIDRIDHEELNTCVKECSCILSPSRHPMSTDFIPSYTLVSSLGESSRGIIISDPKILELCKLVINVQE